MIQSATTPEAAWVSVVLDARLSPASARAVLLVLTMGPGVHPVSRTEFSALLNHPGDRAIQEAVGMAVRFGWLKRTAGGKGHPDGFEFRSALGADLNFRWSLGADLNDFRSATGADLNDVVVDVGSSREVDGTREREVLFPIAETAVATVTERAADFTGCRGSLLDYLARRVPTSRQHGYVHALAGWFDGIDVSVFRYPNGTKLPRDQWPKVIAAALNELMATDEGLMSRPVGDTGNLKTKIHILLKQWAHNGTANGGGTPAQGGSDPGERPRGRPAHRIEE